MGQPIVVARPGLAVCRAEKGGERLAVRSPRAIRGIAERQVTKVVMVNSQLALQYGRNAPRELVVVEIQLRQPGEIAQLR